MLPCTNLKHCHATKFCCCKFTKCRRDTVQLAATCCFNLQQRNFFALQCLRCVVIRTTTLFNFQRNNVALQFCSYYFTLRLHKILWTLKNVARYTILRMDRTMFASDRYFKACSRHMCVLLTYFPPLSFITDVLIVLQILKSDRGFWGSVLATFGFLVSILVSLVTNLGNTCMHMPLPSLLAFTSLTLTLFPCEYVVFAFNEPYLWKGLFDDYSYDPLMRFCLKGIRVKQFPRWPPRS